MRRRKARISKDKKTPPVEWGRFLIQVKDVCSGGGLRSRRLGADMRAALAAQQVVRNGRCHEHGRVGTESDTDQQCEGKGTDHLSTEDKEHQYRQDYRA